MLSMGRSDEFDAALQQLAADLSFITESIRAALLEIEQCDEISQGVEDDLATALEILEGVSEEKE